MVGWLFLFGVWCLRGNDMYQESCYGGEVRMCRVIAGGLLFSLYRYQSWIFTFA